MSELTRLRFCLVRLMVYAVCLFEFVTRVITCRAVSLG
jgi:hypothetical protein